MTQSNVDHTAHVGRRLIDVSTLPTHAMGHRDPLWWGLWMLIAIEGTMFALLGTAYLYLRGNFRMWPPPGAENPPLIVTLSTVIALLASAVPLWFVYRAAAEGRLRTLQRGMLLGTILSAVAAAARAYEIAALDYNWNSHAYGSVVWALYFMHTFHLLAGVVENGVATVLLYRGPVEKKHMLDLRLSTIYWWFVVASWLVLWAMFTYDNPGVRA